MLSGPGLFITGTDTGVGKTAVTAAIAFALQEAGRRVLPLKPVQTGWDEGVTADATFVLQALGSAEPLDVVCPYPLRLPAAPPVAARAEGVAIDVERVVLAFESLRERCETVLVEGAGGLLVEITRGYTMADMAARLQLPLIVVARPGLGTLNHTQLTVEAARLRGLTVQGIVIAGFPPSPTLVERTNPAELTRLCKAPLLGVLPFDPCLSTEGGALGALLSWAVDALAPELAGRFDSERFIAGLLEGPG